MNARAVMLIAIFAALKIVLNPGVSGLGIPFLPIPTLFLHLGEIPIIVIFLLFGFKFAVPVVIIGCLFLFAVWPGPSAPFLPLGELVAEFSVMLGIYVVFKTANLGIPEGASDAGTGRLIYATASAILFRAVMEMFLMYGLLKLVVPAMPDIMILTVVFPWLAVFNIVQTLITLIPSFVVTRTVGKSLQAAMK